MATKRNNKTNSRGVTHPNELGKIPPQALDVEEVVLGALMLEKDAFAIASEHLRPESFYKESHQKIYMAIRDLALHNHPIDLLTVAEQLKKNNDLDDVGGVVYLSQLTNSTASASHIDFHAKIIAQKHLQRELIRVASEVLTHAYDESVDVMDLLGEAEGGIFELSQRESKRDAQQINPVIKEAMEQIREAAKSPGSMSGVPSGFERLDEITSGWQKSDLVIIAARPAMGKTAFVLSMARLMAIQHQVGVAVFSLEMSNIQLINRLIVSETELAGEKIKNGNLAQHEWEQLDVKIKNLMDAPIYVDDTPGLSIFELRAKARRLVSRFDVKILIIDYLQLMTAAGMHPGSREQEVSMISRSLKGLAKELNIPIIALSQLNRGVEGRTGIEGKKPQLADLRESGAIEQDADMVMFIHRPEYYKIFEDEKGVSLLGKAEIIVAKHRNGAIGSVYLNFRSELARFENSKVGIGDGKEITVASHSNVPHVDQSMDELPQGDLGAQDFQKPPF